MLAVERLINARGGGELGRSSNQHSSCCFSGQHPVTLQQLQVVHLVMLQEDPAFKRKEKKAINECIDNEFRQLSLKMIFY